MAFWAVLPFVYLLCCLTEILEHRMYDNCCTVLDAAAAAMQIVAGCALCTPAIDQQVDRAAGTAG
jgi:hypothetical protein